jgi:hypothetical protein
LVSRFLPATRAACIFRRRAAPSPELQSAFGHLLAVAEQARQQQTVVRLKAPTCAIRWLVPRLVSIERRHGTANRLTTTTEHGVNFRTEPYDAAIVLGLTTASAICCLKRR